MAARKTSLDSDAEWVVAATRILSRSGMRRTLLALAQHPGTVADVAEACGSSPNSVRRRLASLARARLVKASGRRVRPARFELAEGIRVHRSPRFVEFVIHCGTGKVSARMPKEQV